MTRDEAFLAYSRGIITYHQLSEILRADGKVYFTDKLNPEDSWGEKD